MWPSSSYQCSSSLPVSRAQAGRSTMAPRSVASTLRTCPGSSSPISLPTLTTGMGQSCPRQSRTRSSFTSAMSFLQPPGEVVRSDEEGDVGAPRLRHEGAGAPELYPIEEIALSEAEDLDGEGAGDEPDARLAAHVEQLLDRGHPLLAKLRLHHRGGHALHPGQRGEGVRHGH